MPAAELLSRALEKIRVLPVQSIARERFYNSVYHLVCMALELIIEDQNSKDPQGQGDPSVQQSLKGDLNDLVGG